MRRSAHVHVVEQCDQSGEHAEARVHIAMAERLVGVVGTGRAVTVEGAAHYPNMERPAAFDGALAELLRSL